VPTPGGTPTGSALAPPQPLLPPRPLSRLLPADLTDAMTRLDLHLALRARRARRRYIH